MSFKRIAVTLAITGLFAITGTHPVSADTVVYNSLAAFQAASSTTLSSTFESFAANGETSQTITDGGITFTTVIVIAPLGIVRPGGPGDSNFNPNVVSKVLTANGNENFNITFGSLTPTAVGFDVYTNQFGPPIVTVFNTSNVLIGTFTLTQAPNTLGFFGVTSDQAIGRINFLATGGEIQNTGIDNVRVGSAAPAAVPEPTTLLLLVTGLFGAVGAARRRRKKI